MDVGFMCNYKGMLYPLQLDQDKKETHCSNDLCTKSLVDICAEKIVQDGSSTSRAIEVVPSELCYSLMKAALLNTRDRAIEVLISRWPWGVLSLSKLTQCMFTDLRALYSDAYVAERMRRGVKYTTCLAHTFVECLKKRSPTKLKYLDISGYPTAEVIVTYLSSHALLVYNEARQKEIISMYNEVAGNLPSAAKQKYQLETTLPEERYMINLDAFVQTEDTHMELCKALRLSNENQSRLKLRINKLDLVNLGVARIAVLLDQIDPEHLAGLSIQYNGIGCTGLGVLTPTIKKMKCLTGLDLSCNNLSLAYDHERTTLLGETLANLPLLKRFDLGNNRIKNKLSAILSGISQPLTHLKLSACGLGVPDLEYLTRSNHAEHLEELDLSENNLGRHFEQFCSLLRVLGKHLKVLETEDCRLDQTHFTHLLHITSRNLSLLRFWNVSRNIAPSTSEMLLADMKPLAMMPLLETFLVSYPTELMTQSVEQPIEHSRLTYQRRLHIELNKLCANTSRKQLNIVMINS